MYYQLFRKIFFLIFAITICYGSFNVSNIRGSFSLNSVNAQEDWSEFQNNLDQTRHAAGYAEITTKEKNIESIISNIIKIILSFTGAVFLMLVLIGGYQWMVAGGNEEKLGQAKQRIINSIIGIIIVLSAYLFTHFITTVFISVTGV